MSLKTYKGWKVYLCLRSNMTELKQNVVYNENCLTTMGSMSDNFVDLTITSPPYDNLRAYNGYSFDFEKVATELYRITKDGGVVVWIVNDSTIKGSETLTSFRQAIYFKDCGFNVHDTMIYKKNALTFPETNRYYPCFEYMFILSKGKPKTVNLITDRKNKQSQKTISGTERMVNGNLQTSIGARLKRKIKENGVRFNVWEYNVGWSHSYKESYLRGHPAIFPELLVNDHILSWSNKGDLVYDPFMGSGTTAKMAILNSRNYIGSEISQEYYEKYITKRIRDANLQKPLF